MANFDDVVRDIQSVESLQILEPKSGPPLSFPFTDFPEDVQLCILSFLTSSEISAFSATSKRFNSLCRDDAKLWFSLCDRRWGHKTQVKKWGNGRLQFKLLYKTLIQLENIIGFWRRIGRHLAPIVFFEWGPCFLTGSRVSPSENGGYRIVKTPFLWMGLSSKGELVNYLDPGRGFDFNKLVDELVEVDADLVPVSVNFVGKNHFVVEENVGYHGRKLGLSKKGEEDLGTMDEFVGVENLSPGSPPDVVMLEIYQYFANQTSPGGCRAIRRNRKKERGRNGRRKFETEHYVKIVNCEPTASRPLQGLWKGICDDMSLDFYLVTYDDIGGMACRKVGDSVLYGYSPVFWTSNSTFIESPFSREEEDLYERRVHIRPHPLSHNGNTPVKENEGVSRVLHINSSYDLVIPDLTTTAVNHWHVGGRIWQYEDGTFGFGFLRNSFIVDLKHIALNGHLLDTVEHLNEESGL